MSTVLTERHASPELVAQLVHEVRQQLANQPPAPLVIGVRAQADWTHGQLTGDDGTIQVTPCATPLAVRQALATFGSTPTQTRDTLVILTPLAEADLGADILGRFVRPRLLYLNSWNAVCQRLGVRRLDPDYGTSALAWMADALLTIAEPSVPPAMSTLSVDAGLHLLAKSAFGADTLTLDGLLRATTSPEFDQHTRAAGDELVTRLATTLGPRLGPAGPLVCGTIAGGRGPQALPAGLAAATVVGATGHQYAHAMLEAVTGCTNIADTALSAWAQAAQTALATLEERESRQVADLLTAGSQLVADWRAPHPEASTVLAAGFEARLAILARELDSFLDNRDGADLASVRQVVADVRNHSEATTPLSRHRAVRAELAARLAVWLRDPASDANGTAAPTPAEPPTGTATPTGTPAPAGPDTPTATPTGAPIPFGRLLDGYLADGAWVDLARRRVDEGDDHPAELLAVLSRISKAAYEQRRAGNQRFARSLAHWTETGTADNMPGDLVVAVEAILDRVVVPLAQAERALLVVLDGCGVPAFLEIVGQFPSLGFTEIGRDGRRQAGLAALPTITEISRASLLCGRLDTGNAQHESRGLVAHDAVRHLDGPPAQCFHHRPDLITGVGYALPPHVLAALSANGPRLVAAVVNTIDDELSRGDFTREYAIQHLGPLQGLLRAAADAGRYVIITADHGHVLGVGLDGRGDARRSGDGGDRWRDAELEPHREPAEDEVLLHGPRVLRGGQRGVIAPAQDDLRYSAKHGGYHGGATPEECLVPLSVFHPPGVVPPDPWQPVSVAPPGWWDLAVAGTPPGKPPGTPPGTPLGAGPASRPAPKKTKRTDPTPGQAGLFSDDPPAATPGTTPSTTPGTIPGPDAAPGPERHLVQAPWADDLVTSATYASQLSSLQRSQPTEADVRAVLGACHARGGTAGFAVLAEATGKPATRIPGLVTILERLLNVDGFGVLISDRTAREVRLDESLLKTQFLDGQP